MSTDLIVRAQTLDSVVEQYSNMLINGGHNFQSGMRLAEAIGQMRLQLDDEMMKEIVKLQNTSLGFLTDRPNDKNPNPYAIAELRDTIIEATLRGFYVIGNEFNVISGKFYAAKNGLRRKVFNFPGLTDFKETYSIPKTVSDRGVIVTGSATWKKDGIPQSLEREFAVRLNLGMGSDGALGKAARKLYAAVLNQLSGIVTPEGEIDEELPNLAAAKVVEPNFGSMVKTQVPSAGVASSSEEPPRPRRGRPPKSPTPAEPISEPKPEPEPDLVEAGTTAEPEPPPLEPREQIKARLAEAKIEESKFLELTGEDSIELLSPGYATMILKRWPEILKQLSGEQAK